MIRVLIADDHTLVRQGIRALLEKAGGIEVVGEAATGQEAIELAERLDPDVLLMDINMPRLNGIQAIERLHGLRSATRVVALSMYSDATLVRQALQSGARGYLLKSSVALELLLAVEAAHRGEVYLSPAVAGPLLADTLNPPAAGSPDDDNALGRLSPREREVLKLVAEGKTTAEIAETLVIAVKTVEKHRTSLMSKLDVHDVAGLVRMALKYRLIFLEE